MVVNQTRLWYGLHIDMEGTMENDQEQTAKAFRERNLDEVNLEVMYGTPNVTYRLGGYLLCEYPNGFRTLKHPDLHVTPIPAGDKAVAEAYDFGEIGVQELLILMDGKPVSGASTGHMISYTFSPEITVIQNRITESFKAIVDA